MLLAVIREEECVGCAKCLPACPIDAIIGATHFTHTVLADECIGCKLCIDPCPMDCIELIEHTVDNKAERAEKAKQRYQAKQKRLIENEALMLPAPNSSTDRHQIRSDILAAIQRVEAKKNDSD